MPVELFGISIGRSKKEALVNNTPVEPKAASFTLPELDDAMPVDAGGHYGVGIDLDVSLRSEAQFIAKYREMSMQPEAEQAVEDICNEAIVNNEEKYPIGLDLSLISSLSDSVKDRVDKEFDHILRLLDFNNRGYEIFRRWYIDGKGYYHMIVDKSSPKKGIIEMRPIDAAKIKKIAKVEKKADPKTGAKTIKGVKEVYVFREKPTDSSAIEIAPEAICYYPSGLYDASRTRAISYLQKAIKPLNQLRMVEDATVIYRLSRAPERRIFYVDVGSLPKNKAEQYVQGLMNRYRNKLVYDANTGDLKNDQKHMSMLEDFWLPRREGGRGTEISTLPGGQNLGEIDDIVYFQKKVYKSLNVPVGRINPEEQSGGLLGRASEITRDEYKFQKFIDRLRLRFSELFTNILKKQLMLKGIITEEDWNTWKKSIVIDFITDNYFTELKESEILRERVNMLREIEPYLGTFYSKQWVQKNVLMFTDDDTKKMQKDMEDEKKSGEIPEPDPEE